MNVSNVQRKGPTCIYIDLTMEWSWCLKPFKYSNFNTNSIFVIISMKLNESFYLSSLFFQSINLEQHATNVQNMQISNKILTNTLIKSERFFCEIILVVRWSDSIRSARFNLLIYTEISVFEYFESLVDEECANTNRCHWWNTTDNTVVCKERQNRFIQQFNVESRDFAFELVWLTFCCHKGDEQSNSQTFSFFLNQQCRPHSNLSIVPWNYSNEN